MFANSRILLKFAWSAGGGADLGGILGVIGIVAAGKNLQVGFLLGPAALPAADVAGG
jgi:hypothetical protein